MKLKNVISDVIYVNHVIFSFIQIWFWFCCQYLFDIITFTIKMIILKQWSLVFISSFHFKCVYIIFLSNSTEIFQNKQWFSFFLFIIILIFIKRRWFHKLFIKMLLASNNINLNLNCYVFWDLWSFQLLFIWLFIFHWLQFIL